MDHHQNSTDDERAEINMDAEVSQDTNATPIIAEDDDKEESERDVLSPPEKAPLEKAPLEQSKEEKAPPVINFTEEETAPGKYTPLENLAPMTPQNRGEQITQAV